MSSYLEKLRARKRLSGELPKLPKEQNPAREPTGGTVKTAKTPFGSNGSAPSRHFSGIAQLPSWCRPGCPSLRRLELRGLPPVLACYRVEAPTRWIWARLDRMSGCPMAKGKDPLPPLTPAPPPPPTTGPPVAGLPCAACGSTSYRRVVDGYTYPDGTRTDGWHCGGRECHVKLLTGNREVDR